MDNNQIYRAPSLPKISRRNISSTVMSGAQSVSNPRLKRSTFSFIRPRISGSQLKSEEIVSETLVETNRILVEIQKQLALDFANRIVEKKNDLKTEKIRLTRERASKKEESLESGKKKEDGAFKPFDKITQKVKGIFDKILEFFTIIATGLIVNNALDWISKKENQEKVKQFFDFVGKYWKELLALFIGYKITKFILRIKKLTDLFRKKPPGGNCGCDDKKNRPGGGPQDPCSTFRTCIDEISPSTVESLAEKIANTTRFNPLFNLLPTARPTTRPPVSTPTTRPPVSTPTRPPVSQIYGDLPPGVLEDLQKGGKTTDPLIDFLGILAAVGAAFGITQLLAGAGVVGTGAAGTGAAGTGAAGTGAASTGAAGTVANTINILTRQRVPRSKGGTIPKFSSGGSVGGRGSGNVDSVNTMLAPGEEVIRTSAAEMFRPLLKDINNNAGKKWIEFSNSVNNMLSYNKRMQSSLDNLNKNMQVFKEQLDKFTKKQKGTKGPKGPSGEITLPKEYSKESGTNLILPTSVVHSNLKSTTRPVTRTTIPINLPTKTRTSDFKMPPIDGGMANDDPDISSVNVSNEYMFLTPKMYGIFV